MKDFQFKIGQEAIQTLGNYQESVVGLSSAAFVRLVPAFFLGNYQLFCLKNSQELDLIRKFVKVRLLQKPQEEVRSFKEVLFLSKNRGFFKKIGKPQFLVYRSREELEEMVQECGFKTLANPLQLVSFYEKKKNFRNLLKSLSLEMISGEMTSLKSLLSWQKINDFQKKYGEKIVLQFAEFGSGGSGTFFIKEKSDFENFLKKLDELYEKEELIKKFGDDFDVLVLKFIKGVSPSMTGCATRFGTLTGVLQTQALGIPGISPRRSEGTFCGHDWYFKEYDSFLQKQAEGVVKRLGNFFYKKGYRGIFGIDFILDEENQKIYPVECNPRYTGAFPIYAFLQMEQGEPPFDVFHLLELADLDYEIDFEKLQNFYRQTNKKGAHLRLRNQQDFNVKTREELASGIYKQENGQLRFLRPGLFPWEIKEESEFLLTGGLPKKETPILARGRLATLIFKKGILQTPNSLKEEIKEIIKAVYNNWQIVESDF